MKKGTQKKKESVEHVLWTGNKIMDKMSKMNRVILEKKILSNWSMKGKRVVHSEF